MDASDRRQRASEEAASWWVRIGAGELERTEREEFVDWLRESPVHVAEMLRIAKVNDALDQFQGWLQVNTDGPDDEENVVALPELPKSESRPALPRTAHKRYWTGLIAAGAALLVLGPIGLFLGYRAHVIETDRGERREVALTDGSVVEVDPESRLRLAFEEHTRRIFLERGRALFKVAKDPQRPFLVEADGATVRAVGTAFGVEHRKQDIVVTVVEGKVAVSGKETSLPGPASAGVTTLVPAAQSPQDLLLIAGEQVRMPLSTSTQPLGKESVRKVDSERELAWARGQLVFDDKTVAEAVAEFNHYNRIQLRVADAAIGMRTVSGVFDASDPESFIAFLQTDTTVHVTRSGSEMILQ